MKTFAVTAAAALTLAAIPLAASAQTEQQAAPQEASIPFANLGGIRNWQADGRDALWIEGRNRKWYRAELMSPCLDLPWAESIGFVSEPSGEFDRFSAIVVRGQLCNVRSLVESGPPPKRSERKKQG